MNDDDLLKSLGKAIRDEAAARPERALEGSLDEAFEERVFGELGLPASAPAAEVAPRNVIPFPPNRARSTTRLAGGLGAVFAAAAAVALIQRGTGDRIGAYDLAAQSERLERGSEEVASARIVASVGRPLTLVLRPATQTTATPEVRVFATLGAETVSWAARIEASPTGAMRVTLTPDRAGSGVLKVVLSPEGDTQTDHARALERPLEVRNAP